MMPAVNGDNVVTLKELLADFGGEQVQEDVAVNDISIDSRSISKGDVFIALQGTQVHGLKYAAAVIEQGAVAIVMEQSEQGEELLQDDLLQQKIKKSSAQLIKVKDLTNVVGLMADRFFGYPSKALNAVGITGTNGKTSCAQFISQILNEDAPSSVIGTIGNGLVNSLSESTHTTPDVITVHRMMKDFVGQGAKSSVMEVSSHGLEQGRVVGIQFQTVLFTNLSHDHLDYHGDMESYGAAKKKLFDMPGIKAAVINADDEFGSRLIAEYANKFEVIDYSVDVKNINAKVRATSIFQDKRGMQMHIVTPWGEADIHSPLLGRFNASNLLASLAVAVQGGISFENARTSLAGLGNVDGRMERVEVNENDPLAVVDYAHTPDALEKALTALREHVDLSAGAELWCVFGCGGDRDKDKRQPMGNIASQFADRVIVTNDNPRTEDAQLILDEIAGGVADKNKVRVISSRVNAIEYALVHAKDSDVILVAGKGHETYQIFGTEKKPYPGDDEVIKTILAQRKNKEDD